MAQLIVGSTSGDQSNSLGAVLFLTLEIYHLRAKYSQNSARSPELSRAQAHGCPAAMLSTACFVGWSLSKELL